MTYYYVFIYSIGYVFRAVFWNKLTDLILHNSYKQFKLMFGFTYLCIIFILVTIQLYLM